MKTLAQPVGGRLSKSGHAIGQGLLAAAGLVLVATLAVAAVGVTGRTTVDTSISVDQARRNALMEFRRGERGERSLPAQDPDTESRHVQFMQWKEERMER